MKKLKNMLEEWQKAGMLAKDLFKGENLKIEDADDKKHTILFVISDETVDRVGERMIASGCKLENYNNTGKPFLWCHNRKDDNPPIGRGVWANLVGDKIKVLTEFYADKGNAWSDFCKTIYEMYRDDFMQSVSIGYIPGDRRDPTEEETKIFPDLKLITETWELLEHSAVPVPGNPNANQEKIIQEKLIEVKEAIDNKKIIIPSICLDDFGIKEEEKIEGEDYGYLDARGNPITEKEILEEGGIEEPIIKDDEKVKPTDGESEEDFIPRCIGVLIEEGRKPEQASAICHSVWDRGKSKDTNCEEYPVYNGIGEKIGYALIPKTEPIKEKKETIQIVESIVRLKDSKENPENLDERESISLTEEQIKKLSNKICSACQKDIADSVIREFKRKLGIVDIDKT